MRPAPSLRWLLVGLQIGYLVGHLVGIVWDSEILQCSAGHTVGYDNIVRLIEQNISISLWSATMITMPARTVGPLVGYDKGVFVFQTTSAGHPVGYDKHKNNKESLRCCAD